MVPIPDGAATAARAAAQRLAADYGPALPQHVEAALHAPAEPPTRYVDPVAIGGLIVAVATLAWTVYHDLRTPTPPRAPTPSTPAAGRADTPAAGPAGTSASGSAGMPAHSPVPEVVARTIRVRLADQGGGGDSDQRDRVIEVVVEETIRAAGTG